jgi:acyl-CoA thioesterase I
MSETSMSLRLFVALTGVLITPLLLESQTSTAAQMEHMQKQLQDWPNLARYRADNAKLGAPAASENRVVFMGDSITDGWGRGEGTSFFPGKPYVNRGISGQTTPQMVVRFEPDVVALRPKVVVILAATNDIAGNTGPMSLEDTENNFKAMVAIAQRNHVGVVLASITPAFAYPWKPGVSPVDKIKSLNSWLKSYAQETGSVYLDYYSAMADGKGAMKEGLSKDGVHPTAAGYSIMTPLAEKAISQALKQQH